MLISVDTSLMRRVWVTSESIRQSSEAKSSRRTIKRLTVELEYFVVPVAAKTPEQLQKKEKKKKAATNWSLTASTSAHHVCSRAGTSVQLDGDDGTSGSHLRAQKRGREREEAGGGRGQWPTSCCVSLSAGLPAVADGPMSTEAISTLQQWKKGE